MKKYIKTIGIFLFVFILSIFNSILAQEYDDMYFTKSDRKQIDFNLKPNRGDAERALAAIDDDYLEEVYLDKYINPEYIAKYQVQSAKKSSSGNQEVDYYPEANSNNISTTSGYFNNYGRQVTPYQTASFKINFVNTYGFTAYNNRFLYGYDPFYNVWISDFYSPYSPYGYNSYGFSPYAYNPYDPYGYGFARPFYSSGFNIVHSYSNVRAFNNFYCPSAYSYNTGSNSVALTQGYQEVRRAKVIGPRGSGGSKTVIRGAVTDGSSTDLNRNVGTNTTRLNSSLRYLDSQKSQNEYLDRSVVQRGTNQPFTRSNAVEAQSRAHSVRNTTRVNQRNTTINNERSSMGVNSRGVTTQINSSRRYNTTTMPDRNDFNLPKKGDTRNSYQNTDTRYPSSSSLSGVKTNSTPTPSTSRSYKPSNNSSSGLSRSYSVPSSSGSRSSGSSLGSRSSGGSSRSIKN
ncbi:MAG: hypothetical protein CMB82_04770 [Flammeovirgaceae bacterium]|nr:hypothetical protein [Flammeovirgaceae bacterium]